MADFAPYTESYQASRPTAAQPYQPLLASDPSSAPGQSTPSGATPLGSAGGGASLNPFANVTYRSPATPGSAAAEERVNKYETSLPLRVDAEAAACYVFGCFSGLVMLIAEQKNDYVRFHAWQSTMTFALLLMVQFLLGWISDTLATLVMISGIALAVFLAFKAYQNGTTLERYHVPYIGRYASEWVDAE